MHTNTHTHKVVKLCGSFLNTNGIDKRLWERDKESNWLIFHGVMWRGHDVRKICQEFWNRENFNLEIPDHTPEWRRDGDFISVFKSKQTSQEILYFQLSEDEELNASKSSLNIIVVPTIKSSLRSVERQAIYMHRLVSMQALTKILML